LSCLYVSQLKVSIGKIKKCKGSAHHVMNMFICRPIHTPIPQE
jgi:hypothetical protein